jgi:PEP-CTERM motif
MKTIVSISSILIALAMITLPAKAQVTYAGTGDADGGGGSGEGISSVVINNDASDITFTINTSMAQSQYVQYFILMQYVGQGASGSTAVLNSAGALNGWGPSLGISTGENAFAATYNTGATPAYYSGGVWTQGSGVSYDAGGTGDNFLTFTVPLSSLGLSVGSSFYFDVVSSYPNSVGQSAYGALDSVGGYPAESDGSYEPYLGSNYYDAATPADAGTDGSTFGTAASEYTVQAVPEPTMDALLGTGVLFLTSFRRRNK